MSLDYLRKWGFEEFKTGQVKYSASDCFVRSISAILCIQPDPLYKKLNAKRSSFGDITHDINTLIRSEDPYHEEIHFDTMYYHGARLSMDPDLVARLVEEGGEGSYVAITEEVKDSDGHIIRQERTGHATVLTIRKVDGQFRIFTSDFQNYTQYEGLPVRHIIPGADYRIKNQLFKFSFIKITNGALPLDSSKPILLSLVSERVKLCQEKSEAIRRVSGQK
jgi:hypothetical protein